MTDKKKKKTLCRLSRPVEAQIFLLLSGDLSSRGRSKFTDEELLVEIPKRLGEKGIKLDKKLTPIVVHNLREDVGIKPKVDPKPKSRRKKTGTATAVQTEHENRILALEGEIKELRKVHVWLDVNFPDWQESLNSRQKGGILKVR